jgi:MoxR-like ATPase
MKARKPKKLIPIVAKRSFDALVEDSADSRIKLARNIRWAKRQFIERDEVVESIFTGILSRQHVMLVGKHGLAKSQMAQKCFSCFEGFNVFSKQFRKDSSTDEIFGPLNIKEYETNAVWSRNTNKMLPTAHFAFLDEVYRAADMLLPSMFMVLNERKFINAGETVDCPLITAIGTTNFISDIEELNAFHDRWGIWQEVLPVSTKGRAELVELYNDPELEGRKPDPLTPEDLTLLVELHKAMEIDPEFLDFYLSLVEAFERKANDFYVSDRRLCQVIDSLKARAILNNSLVLDPTSTYYAKSALLAEKVMNPTIVDAFMECYGGGLSDIERIKKRKLELQKVVADIEELENNLKSKTDKSTLQKDYDALLRRLTEDLYSEEDSTMLLQRLEASWSN